MKKRFISILLTAFMVLTLLPNLAYADYYNPYNYTVYLKLNGVAASPQDLDPNKNVLCLMATNFNEEPKGTFNQSDMFNTPRLIRWGLYTENVATNIYTFFNNAFYVSLDNPLTINCYTVTYKPGTNGEGSELTEIAANGADYTFRGATFTRPDYVQTGWATSDGGDKVYDLGGVKNDINIMTELYPVWALASHPVTITVKKDGNEFGVGAPTITFGTAIDTAVPNGTSVLDGTYNIYANGIDTGVNVTVSGSAASVDLNYYTVTFRNEDDTSTLDTQTVLSGQTAAYGGAPLSKASTAQYSYAFSKWVTTSGGATEATLSNITAAKTVYASFTPTLLSYTITWKKDASTPIDASPVAYGATPTHSTPSNTGYTFSGWTPAVASVTGAATYTATWTLDTYSISYTLNGGTLATANPTGYTIETSTFTLNNPDRSGYSFVGWTGSNGTTAQTNVNIPKGSTENKSYTANWQANKPAAPTDAIVTARTDTSLTITTQADYEYSVDSGTHWCSSATGSYTFTGLASGTTYNLVCRKAAVSTGNISSASDASGALPVSTKTASVLAPTPPTIGTDANKPTSNSITVSAVKNNEYYISTSATADWSGAPSGYFKATADGTHKFDSLDPATQYYIHVRTAETDSAMPSASACAAQYTLPETPIAGVGYSVDYAAEKIAVAGGYEVSTNADFTGTAVASDAPINPNTTYYVRVAASGGAPASEARSFTIPARPATPAAITADKTKNSITITPVAGQEYKIGTGTWQTSGSFKDLSANTDYTVYARVKAVTSGSVSFASDAYSIIIKTKTDGAADFALPTISVTPTYAPGQTLSDIALPTGWTWSAPATVPTVINTGYGAIYTPTDTDTVDYSGVTGYAVDGFGKVTITRVVPLAVNRAAPTAADFTFDAPASLNFSDTVKTATVTAKAGISGMGTVAVRYYLDGVETTPKAAGTYTVKVDLAEGSNYAAASAVTHSDWTFTIAKVAQASLSIPHKPSITYRDTFTLAAEGGSGDGLVTWESSDVNSATVDASGAVIIKGVGETTITATKAADGNHTAAVTATYTFTPAKRLITVDDPTATGGWTKVYDGKEDFDSSLITAGAITNKVGSDDITVTVHSAAYDSAAIGSGDKTLTITYAIDGAASGNYSAPANTVISMASITAAAPTITLKSKTAAYTNKKTEIGTATVKGVEGGTTPDGAITYTYYTKDTCTDADKTTVDKSGAETAGGAPKTAGTYFVTATIAASGNYTAATSAAVTLTIYAPASEDKASAPVIVDGKAVDMGTPEVKDGTTTIKVDQDKMSEQLKNAKDSVVIPITTKTDTASAQLVVQNVENMAARSMTLTVKANDVSYEIPTGSVDTAAILKNLGASDSAKVPLTVTISKLSNSAVTIKDGTLMVTPVAFTITATYNGKKVEVDRFHSYVQRVLEIPSGVDPKKITTAVVAESNGTQRHVPTDVYFEGGKWYAKINSMTNSTYALIQNTASFTDTSGKWYAKVVTEMASRKVLSGIGENMFAGDRSITRAEFAAILIRALGLPADGTSTFSDVSSSAWYSGAVATAAQYGLVTGKGLNRFAPNASITRQEAMTMLQSAAKLTDYSGTAGSLAGFTDAKSVGTWAQGAAKWSVGSGLIVGSGGLLRPNDTITRAECATVILRLLQKAELVDVRS